MIDGNIPAPVVEWLLAVAASVGARVVLEPVSVTKAGRIAPLLGAARPVFAMTPNVDELGALVGEPVADTTDAIAAAAATLHERGVHHVWVTRGAAGSLLVSRDAEPVHLVAHAREVVDVTGAGDAMTAGFVFGLLRAATPVDAARLGQFAAALTVESGFTVRPDLGVAIADFRRTNQGVR